jgi:hypothetical protein
MPHALQTTIGGGKMRIILSFSLFVFLAGCSTQTVFIVLRDIPTSPTFVVLPANNYLYQVEFANTVQSYLLSSGVKVVTRPATKEIEATKQAGQVDAQQSQVSGGALTLTERYWALEDTEADYIVYTYADTRQVTIARKHSKEILASFTLKATQYQKEDQVFREAISRLLGR